jgi:hypothetical protein
MHVWDLQVIWFGHGLWGLPNDGVLLQNDPNLDCAVSILITSFIYLINAAETARI